MTENDASRFDSMNISTDRLNVDADGVTSFGTGARLIQVWLAALLAARVQYGSSQAALQPETWGSLPFALTLVVAFGALAGARFWLALLSPLWLVVALGLGLLLLVLGVGPAIEFVSWLAGTIL